MKQIFVARKSVFASALIFALLVTGVARAEKAVTNDFSAFGKSVVQLLESRDAEAFAKELSPSLENWRSVQSTNAAAAKDEDPLGPNFQKYLEYSRKKLSAGAQNILDKATQLGLEPARVRFRVKEVTAKSVGTFRSQGNELPWSAEVKVILVGEPILDIEADKSFRGEYELVLNGLLKFPVGWRCNEGIQWTRFPETVADERTQRETKILSLVSARKSLTGSDDSALAELSKAMLRFLQSRDEKVFVTEAMLTSEEVWKRFEKESAQRNQPLPPRKEFEAQFRKFNEKTLQSVREVLAQVERLEMDFAGAKEGVMARNLTTRGAAGSLENLNANSITFKFTVPSGKKSKSGRSLSGEYILSSGDAMRMGDQWKIQDPIRWEKLPDGLMDSKEAEKLEFENYVAEHGALPPGTPVPEIEFVRLDNDTKAKLSDFRGKVVILDFWATWCGPCQEPMAKLQTLRKENPDWKERVEIVSLSIDDTAAKVKQHLEKRGWTNSFNTWAGKGAWESQPAQQFRVRGVPTCYVIGPDGKIIQSGHHVMRIADIINRELGKK